MAKEDRNFDTLIHKFQRQIYDSVKGELRLQLLQEDLKSLHQSDPLTIWDAGCGMGQMALWFAEAHHDLVLCDLSVKMLKQAQTAFENANLNARFLQGAAQEMAPSLPQFDLVLCHAVLEWLAKPEQSLQAIAEKVRPGGYLSLLFYNRNAMVYTNVLKGEWRLKFILENAYLGKGKGLTPPHPQFPSEVEQWLIQWGFDIKTQTGIRVFHDYMPPEVRARSDLDELVALEKAYCRRPNFRHMGRYIHVLAQRPS